VLSNSSGLHQTSQPAIQSARSCFEWQLCLSKQAPGLRLYGCSWLGMHQCIDFRTCASCSKGSEHSSILCLFLLPGILLCSNAQRTAGWVQATAYALLQARTGCAVACTTHCGVCCCCPRGGGVVLKAFSTCIITMGSFRCCC
jgi:hypothetical protein